MDTTVRHDEHPMEAARPVSMRGDATSFMVLSAGLLAALALPAWWVAWALPTWTALPASGWLALLVAQAGVLLALLAGMWVAHVKRPLAWLKASARSLAAGTSCANLAERPSGLLASELGELDGHLRQARQRIVGLMDDMETRHQALHQLAMVDPLTGLPNRRLLRDLFQRASALALRSDRPMALMFIDLDHFKQVNDRNGHPAGDELLRCIGQRLQETMRGSDLVGRLGGDEFVALLPDTANHDAIAHAALRLIRAIELPVPLGADMAHGEVSASIGVARFPRDGDDFDTLLEHADQAMYRAKTLGRGRFAVFQPSLVENERPDANGDGELVHALDHGELKLFFQPVIDTASGQAVGAEALMRWQHPTEGLLPPSRFIHRAEECGQSHALSLSTLDQACAQLAQWKLMGLRTGSMSVNVSAPQFRHANWADDLTRVLVRHHIDPGELAVELTESALLDDPDSTRDRVKTLRGLGVDLVIDDFGSGLISLSSLGELRPAMIKLDPSFVQRLPGDSGARAMVAGIVGLATGLGITVVAEGVETEVQRDALAEVGCHWQQGYLFARPEPALPEPAWPLPAWPEGQAPTTRGANDSEAGDLVPLDLLQQREPVVRG